ncbi:unnamed protein product, partial [Arabidopsis halleri]
VFFLLLLLLSTTFSFSLFFFPLHSFLSIQSSVLSLLLHEKSAVKSRNPP